MRSIHLALLTIGVLFCLSLQTTIKAADSPAYRLAYRSALDKEIWTANPDGSDSQQITHDGADKQGLAASPDGHYLAYYVQSLFEGADTNYLTYQVVVVLNIATGAQHMITGQEAIDGLTWSPDSQRLLFMVVRHPAGSPMNYTLNVINRDGSDRMQLGEVQDTGVGLSWSPDGKHILLSGHDSGGGFQILIMDSNGGHEHLLTSFASCFICDIPRWTPDGQHIIFYKHPDLFILDADGQNLRQLTDFAQVYNVVAVFHDRYGNPQYAITSDSQKLVYTMGYPIQMVEMDLGVDGWNTRRIIQHDLRGVLLTPDDQSVFVQNDFHDLTRINLYTGTADATISNALDPVILTAPSSA
jgi:dipeptidyl aminopeptidase/acylaminoacyl peptidase